MRPVNQVSTKMLDERQVTDSRWDSAISDAQNELVIVERRRQQLKRAIHLLRLNKGSGATWPGDDDAT